MFSLLNSGKSSARRNVLTASLALHGLFLLWLLHAPEPQLLNPISIALGRNGNAVTKLYWSSPTPDNSATSAPDSAIEVYRHQRLGHEKLTWKQVSAPAKLPAPSSPVPPTGVEENAKTATLSRQGHGALAGLPYRTLPGGPCLEMKFVPLFPSRRRIPWLILGNCRSQKEE